MSLKLPQSRESWAGTGISRRLNLSVDMVESQNYWYPFWGGPYSKDRSVFASILGSPFLGELPYEGRVPSRVRFVGKL